MNRCFFLFTFHVALLINIGVAYSSTLANSGECQLALTKKHSDNSNLEFIDAFAKSQSSSLVLENPTSRDYINLIKALSLNGPQFLSYEGKEYPAPLGKTWDSDGRIHRVYSNPKNRPKLQKEGHITRLPYHEVRPDEFEQEFYQRLREQGYAPFEPEGMFSFYVPAKFALNNSIPEYIIGKEVIGFSDPGMEELFLFRGTVESIVVLTNSKGAYGGTYLTLQNGGVNFVVQINETFGKDSMGQPISNIWYSP